MWHANRLHAIYMQPRFVYTKFISIKVSRRSQNRWKSRSNSAKIISHTIIFLISINFEYKERYDTCEDRKKKHFTKLRTNTIEKFKQVADKVWQEKPWKLNGKQKKNETLKPIEKYT